MVSTVLKQAIWDIWPPFPTFKPDSYPDLTNKVALITGSNTGIGFETAKALLKQNATVIFVNRNEEKTERAIGKIKSELDINNDKIILIKCDLSDLEAIKPAVEQIESTVDRIHISILNAGVMQPPVGSMSKQNYELQVATNNLGHQLLQKLIHPLVLRAKTPDFNPRVLWLGSIAHLSSLKPQSTSIDYAKFTSPTSKETNMLQYCQSKTNAIYQSHIYALRHKDEGIISVSCNPGYIISELERCYNPLQRFIFRWLLWAPVYGSYTEMFAVLSPEITIEKSGCYIGPWGQFQEVRSDLYQAFDDGTALKFYDWVEEQIRPYL